ncbi:hypothetical protein L1049_000228 [Liquidambar formosana]|uniref:RRM domain-containing protein n=1 Tax=Liquidambar formosana TaxID=63359 RepID=A0AAP0NA71_LIQFO
MDFSGPFALLYISKSNRGGSPKMTPSSSSAVDQILAPLSPPPYIYGENVFAKHVFTGFRNLAELQVYFEEERREMTIDDDNSIYVGGLPYDATDESIRRVFDLYGSIVAVKIINDLGIGGKCYGFVTFTNPRSAIDAINDMNGRTFDIVKL